jgi:4-hydroxy-3-methylbut-2-enyl diphosphate reductase
MKQNQPEPWSVIDEKYHVGDIVKGKVVQTKDYGAFVELSPGLDGLVHISEVAHKRINKVSDELSIGQEVNVKILEIDKETRRISLSIKETLDPNAEAAPAAENKAAEAVAAVEEKVDEVVQAAEGKAVEVVQAAEEKVDEVVETVKAKAEEVAEAVETKVEEVEQAVEEKTEA